MVILLNNKKNRVREARFVAYTHQISKKLDKVGKLVDSYRKHV
jgi:hypothetical protein